MNGIREWSAVLCMAALAAAIVQYLLPGGAMDKIVRLVLGAFLICSILIPLHKIIPELSMELSAVSQERDSRDFQDTVNAQICSAAGDSIRNLVITELADNQIQCKNVAVMMDTKEDGSIVISKVVVTLDEDAERCAEVQARLEKKLELKTEVN